MFKGIRRLLHLESKRLIKNSSWLFFSTICQTIISFVKTIIIARTLGLEFYGTYAIIMAFVATVQELLNLNFGVAFIKYSSEYISKDRYDKLKAFFNAGLLLALITSIISTLVIIVVLYFSYSTFIEINGLYNYVVLFGIVMSFQYFNQITLSLLRIYERFKYLSFINIISSLVEIVSIIVVLYIYGDNLIALIVALIIANLVNVLFKNGAAYYEIRDKISGFWKQSLSCLKEERKSITRFIFNVSLSKSLQKLLKKGDVLLLAAFTNATQVGLYDAARKLAFSLNMVKDPLLLTVYPQIANLISRNKFYDVKLFLLNIFKLTSPVFLLGFVSIFFFDEAIIKIVFGNEFIGSGSVLFYLYTAVGIEVLMFWMVPLIFSLGEDTYRLMVSFISAIITIIIALILLNPYGAVGLALSLLTGSILTHLMLYIKILKKFNNN